MSKQNNKTKIAYVCRDQNTNIYHAATDGDVTGSHTECGLDVVGWLWSPYPFQWGRICKRCAKKTEDNAESKH